MIEEVLNKAAAVELFESEAILLGQSDVVPFYRAIELFGEEAARFLDENAFIDGYVNCGVDWNGMGACSVERPFTSYLYKFGFLKVVTEHNYLRVIKAHKESEGGHILDRYSEERNRRLEEREAEEERKREERKAKRAAAKAAREAAEKGERNK
ncbi:MAG: hypothetical protein K2J60_07865 [Acetatifactor sp.]|nr:hypothetical protein [Acetatifactor sp.]